MVRIVWRIDKIWVQQNISAAAADRRGAARRLQPEDNPLTVDSSSIIICLKSKSTQWINAMATNGGLPSSHHLMFPFNNVGKHL